MSKNLIADDKIINEIADNNTPIRIMISSLSLGGAEKIVVDWAVSEANRGRCVEISVIHTKEKEHKINSSKVKVLRRSSKSSISSYLKAIKEYWGLEVPVSTHLLNYEMHNYLWELGFLTVPVIHNDLKGWKISPEELNHPNVIRVVACAEYVKNQLIEYGYKGEIKVIRHLPLINNKMVNFENRIKFRNKLKISEDTVVIAAIGAIKAQKNYSRLIEIAKQTNKNVLFMVFGDSVNKEGDILKEELIQKMKKLNISHKITLMGFKSDIYNYYPIFDGVINCSNYEGYSIATQEALLADLPVIATNVSGQSEISLNGLTLLDLDEKNDVFASEINKIKPRKEINKVNILNGTRIWSLSTAFSKVKNPTKTMFLTANLNAGGAQRSLVNLTTNLKSRNEDISVVVCNSSTNSYFSDKLKESNVKLIQLSESRDVFDLVFVLLEEIQKQDIKNLCLWNVDPKMKLLLSEFLPSSVKYYDVSPGSYAFEELSATKDFQLSTTITEKYFYNKLTKLILKYNAKTSLIDHHGVKIKVVNNGVEDWSNDKVFDSSNKDILVSGRLVESKHILSILKAFKEFNTDNSYTLNFYGQSENRNKEYLDKINELAKGQKVIFHGSDPHLSFMNKNFAMTIILGTHQGCPNSALESASSLIPIIANDSGGTREIVKNGESGILIPDNFTHNELVSALFEMKNSDREKFTKVAKDLVSKSFSIEKMCTDYIKLLNGSCISKADLDLSKKINERVSTFINEKKLKTA